MSLAPVWRSTLFGWYFFAGAFWSALAAMALTAVVMRRRLGEHNLFTNPDRHARLRQDGLRVLGVLDLSAVRAVYRHLVRRPSGRDFLHRPAGPSHAVVAAFGGVRDFDLGDSVCASDERAREADAAIARHRVAALGLVGFGSSATCWWFRRCPTMRSRLAGRNF